MRYPINEFHLTVLSIIIHLIMLSIMPMLIFPLIYFVGELQRSDDSEWRQDCLALLLQLLCRIGTLHSSDPAQTPKLHPVSFCLDCITIYS